MNIDIMFTPMHLRNITIKNRLIRSATYEGCSDAKGFPKPELLNIYQDLAQGGIGAIITGFAFISQDGRAMQPLQSGIDNDDKIKPWTDVIRPLKKKYSDTAVFMQLAHTGRQTLAEATQLSVFGASKRKCTYFKQKVHQLTEIQIRNIIKQFGLSAQRAKTIGFDGVQIHAAHGYLIHQFLSSWTNTRKDCWADPRMILTEIVNSIRFFCGDDYPILVKLSAEDDNNHGIKIEDTINTAKLLADLKIDAVEISYGTMEYAFNIIRGKWPINEALKISPLFNKTNPCILGIWKKFFLKKHTRMLKQFTENYNLENAMKIKNSIPQLPLICVGGIRDTDVITNMINHKNIDAVSLCRPLICEPDLPNKILLNGQQKSKCTNCNLCTIYSDSNSSLRCYRFKEKTGDINENYERI